MLLVAPLLGGCHLASGIDGIKIDRRVAEVPKEEFACEALQDAFETLDGARWNVASDEGYDVAHDEDLEAVVVSMADVAADSRAGITSTGKHDFNDCWIIVEVDPGLDENTFAMVALLEEGELEEGELEDGEDAAPLISMRKEGSLLITSRNEDDFQTVPYNADLRFWRIQQEGDQILFDASLRGKGEWQSIARVAKPDAVRAVYVGMFAGAADEVTTDAVAFPYYGMLEEP